MSFLLEKGIFHCYVRLPECMQNLGPGTKGLHSLWVTWIKRHDELQGAANKYKGTIPKIGQD